MRTTSSRKAQAMRFKERSWRSERERDFSMGIPRNSVTENKTISKKKQKAGMMIFPAFLFIPR
jgi:hypothetical protein